MGLGFSNSQDSLLDITWNKGRRHAGTKVHFLEFKLGPEEAILVVTMGIFETETLMF